MNPRDEELVKIFGENVRNHRTLNGLTMVELAYQCNVEYTTISKIERGKINTTISLAVKIAKVLDVPITDLLGV
ncbi:helix-turn-helix domain-containing protein [Pedobacter gandavensis]|uniref:helix-turn-helix domain-containing protein n=1 Tax=Pedobacter gandavensis TaxID=2679963 RepID=UPI003977B79A